MWTLKYLLNKIVETVLHYYQGRSESTSSAAFEILIINCRIEFINLLIFNRLTSNINLFIFNCLTSNLLFCKKNIFRKQKRTAVCGRTSLVLDFKLPGKIMTLYFRDINFEVPHSVHEYTKMRIPNKRCQSNMVRTFWGTCSASTLRHLGVDHFGRSSTKIYGKQEKL